jgi:hypothetical protein
MDHVSRRTMIKAIGAAHHAPATTGLFLNTEPAAFTEAVVERLIPTNDSGRRTATSLTSTARRSTIRP